MIDPKLLPGGLTLTFKGNTKALLPLWERDLQGRCKRVSDRVLQTYHAAPVALPTPARERRPQTQFITRNGVRFAVDGYAP